ncbi:MAG: hypothetical protein ACHQ2E_04335 [Gemmatimonadales bacterium]
MIAPLAGAPRRSARVAIASLLALATGVAAQDRAAGAAPPSVLGYWRGRSTCVKAEWNAACTDENVLYHFIPAADHPGQVLLKAYKYVNGAPESMYDLQFAWDSTRRQWAARYSNSRVRILWSYTVQDTVLTGRLADLPDERLVRNVRATLVADSAGQSPRP